MKKELEKNLYETPKSEVVSVLIQGRICDVSGDNEEVSETEGQW